MVSKKENHRVGRVCQSITKYCPIIRSHSLAHSSENSQYNNHYSLHQTLKEFVKYKYKKCVVL